MVVQAVRQMGPGGVQAFPFAPDGGWVIVNEGGDFARGMPDECFQQIGALRGAGHRIRVVAFPPEGGTCQSRGYSKKRAGFAVLTNGEAGDPHDEIAAALMRNYGWE